MNERMRGEKKRNIIVLTEIRISKSRYKTNMRVSVYNLLGCTKGREPVPEQWFALSSLLGGD